MKNGILIKGTILFLAAGSAWGEEGMRYDQSDKYRANEVSLDMFGSASIGQTTINNLSGDRISNDARLGLGAGLNYFFTRNFGIGGEAYSENTHHNFIDNVSGHFIGRFPIGHGPVAPYVFGGGGRQLDPIYLWYLHAGAGLEVRFTPHVGAFLDARYVFTDGTKNYGLGRAGLRIAF